MYMWYNIRRSILFWEIEMRTWLYLMLTSLMGLLTMVYLVATSGGDPVKIMNYGVGGFLFGLLTLWFSEKYLNMLRRNQTLFLRL